MTDTNTAGGSGAAFGATIKVENTPAALEEALKAARALEKSERFSRAVDKAKKKVDKYQAHLDGAKEALANAEAELADFLAARAAEEKEGSE